MIWDKVESFDIENSKYLKEKSKINGARKLFCNEQKINTNYNLFIAPLLCLFCFKGQREMQAKSLFMASRI